MQGSSYSAEIFARTLDRHLGKLLPFWSKWSHSWLQDLQLILYADDILLLATSEAEMASKIQEIQKHLRLIGLHLADGKLQIIASPVIPAPESLSPRPVSSPPLIS